MSDYEVYDARNNNKQGPFSQEDAQKWANDLNMFVYRNMLPGFAVAEVKGPFYTRKITK
jgi:hypothetical protein